MASECAIEGRMFGEPHLQRDLTDPNVHTRWISQQRESAFEAFLFDKTAEGLSGLLEQKMDVASANPDTVGDGLWRQSHLREVGKNICANAREPCFPNAVTFGKFHRVT